MFAGIPDTPLIYPVGKYILMVIKNARLLTVLKALNEIVLLFLLLTLHASIQYPSLEPTVLLNFEHVFMS